MRLWQNLDGTASRESSFPASSAFFLSTVMMSNSAHPIAASQMTNARNVFHIPRKEEEDAGPRRPRPQTWGG